MNTLNFQWVLLGVGVILLSCGTFYGIIQEEYSKGTFYILLGAIILTLSIFKSVIQLL